MSLFHRAFHLAHYVFPQGGTCLEFGVFKGGTYCYQAQQILEKYSGSTLIGFDSWQGLPVESSEVWAPQRHGPGEFAAPKTELLGKLSGLGIEPGDGQFRLIDGFFSDSLTDELRQTIHDVVFINVDVDIHRSTIELLNFVRPLLRPGVVIYWDDWKDPKDEAAEPWGEHLAWSEWYPNQEGLEVETIEVNPINQRSMLVTRVGDLKLSSPIPSLLEIRHHASQLAEAAQGAADLDSDYQHFLKLKGILRRIPLAKPMVRMLRAVMRR
ncbi:class I SAM-dependent methyltransferase [Rubinisphaera italica]|uniref:Class I SAM-dependent methyltransferase n=1 Tax=Rubinisphaera italica TaxID=2527969 RepID=A0A5C5XHF8_9PLAN|nr:class I SAM-dependent methyltransferase [Rubinisphaera italica]TWT62139.1 hypothetical protein Pan54_28790 [Rubinisphaera italica]